MSRNGISTTCRTGVLITRLWLLTTASFSAKCTQSHKRETMSSDSSNPPIFLIAGRPSTPHGLLSILRVNWRRTIWKRTCGHQLSFLSTLCISRPFIGSSTRSWPKQNLNNECVGVFRLSAIWICNPKLGKCTEYPAFLTCAAPVSHADWSRPLSVQRSYARIDSPVCHGLPPRFIPCWERVFCSCSGLQANGVIFCLADICLLVGEMLSSWAWVRLIFCITRGFDYWRCIISESYF